MLISRKHHFIFIHIYKNAGVSIKTALKPFVLTRYQWLTIYTLRKFKIIAPFDPQPFHAHIKASEVIDLIGVDAFNSFFSFAFVRNPWDWQVSLYKYAQKVTDHYQHDLVIKLGSFDEYIRWRCSEEVRYQKDFIYSSDNKLLVNFVGKLENIDADFEKICKHIGITAALPKLNVSNTMPYQNYYNDETKKLVEKTFQPDIELFKYVF